MESMASDVAVHITVHVTIFSSYYRRQYVEPTLLDVSFRGGH